MAVTYEPIATTTLESNTTITFTSIPSTYTDLRLVITGGQTGEGWDFRWRFNSDTSTNYSQVAFLGDGSSASSSKTSNATKITASVGYNANNLNAVTTVDIFNYKNTSAYKSCLARTDVVGSYGGTATVCGLWRSTSAINTIYIYGGASNDGTGTLYTGTTATLYGILAA